jgi:hypothetical protein
MDATKVAPTVRTVQSAAKSAQKKEASALGADADIIFLVWFVKNMSRTPFVALLYRRLKVVL